MAYYRLYFLNSVSAHIERFEQYEADDDVAAIEAAKRHSGAVPLELWSGRRKVRHFAAPRSFRPRPIQPAAGSAASAPANTRMAD